MDVQTFEDYCRASKFRPLEKQWTRHGAVLVAERHYRANEDPDWKLPHWKVLWSVERDDMKEGQKLTMNDWYELRGIVRHLTQWDRIMAARLCGLQWLEDNVTSGRFA